MWENLKFKSDNGSGSWAAAYFVMTIGMVGWTAFALLWFNEHPEAAWSVLAGFGVVLVLSVLLRRPDLPSSVLSGIFGRRGESPLDYQPRAQRPKSLEYGTNRPPTVEDIREAADGPNNWVPHGSSTGRRSVHSHSAHKR